MRARAVNKQQFKKSAQPRKHGVNGYNGVSVRILAAYPPLKMLLLGPPKTATRASIILLGGRFYIFDFYKLYFTRSFIFL